MFCKNCGAQLADGIKFCRDCGTALVPSGDATQPAQVDAGVATKKSKKGVIIAIASIVAVIAIVVSLVLAFATPKYKTPEKVAKDFVTAYFTADAEKIVNCIPEFFIKKQFGNMDKKTIVSLLKQRISPEDIAPCTVLRSVRVYDNANYLEYMEDIEEYGADFTVMANIKDICFVTVDALVAGETEQLEVLCVKWKNSWYALELD